MTDVDPNESYKAHLRDALLSSSNQFDGSVLTLSSGLLAVSLAFISDVVSIDAAVFRWALLASWIALAGAVLTTMASFMTSQQSTRLYHDDDEQNGRRWGRATARLNLLSAVLFGFGVVLSVVFVGSNSMK